MAYRITQQENVFINGGKKLATWFTFKERGTNVGKTRIRYEVRAGKKGKGRILAKEKCVLGYWLQKAAQDKIKQKLGGVEFMDWVNEESRKKFEDAGYIPDPYER
jgi:hypothetical protein